MASERRFHIVIGLLSFFESPDRQYSGTEIWNDQGRFPSIGRYSWVAWLYSLHGASCLAWHLPLTYPAKFEVYG